MHNSMVQGGGGGAGGQYVRHNSGNGSLSEVKGQK